MALPVAALGAALLIFQSPASPPRLPASASGDSIVLRVLATNDMHGRLATRPEAWSNGRPVGGFAALAGMMNRLTSECGCTTIRVDAGDLMQGTPVSNLTYGRSAIDAANAMGYAAMAIGNHEFDWTIDTLAARIRQSRFTWLSSNIVLAATHTAPRWATPWTIVRAGSLTVALVGYTTPGTTTETNPVNIRTLGFLGAESLDRAIAAARGRHPDFVIVLAHAGAFCNANTGCRGEVISLADALAHKPDLIVSGHTHSLINTTENGIPIIQSRSNGTSLGVIDFLAQPGGGRDARMRVTTVWADRERPDTAVARVVASYESGIDSLTSRPVAVLGETLRPDSTLTDLVAQSLRETAGAQIGLMNVTGVRRTLPAGPVTWGDVFEALPFDNYVVKLTLRGDTLRQAVEHALVGSDVRARLAGLDVAWDPSLPPGRRVTRLTLPDGQPVSDTGHYTLGTVDFLANGGSGYFMLRGLPSANTGTTALDAFIALLRRQPQPVRAGRQP